MTLSELSVEFMLRCKRDLSVVLKGKPLREFLFLHNGNFVFDATTSRVSRLASAAAPIDVNSVGAAAPHDARNGPLVRYVNLLEPEAPTGTPFQNTLETAIELD